MNKYQVVYLLAVALCWVVFGRMMVEQWWDAQGRDKEFEFGGAVWVLLGSGFFAFLWPATLPIAIIGKVIQHTVNRGRRK